jgi:hypothetical protein
MKRMVDVNLVFLMAAYPSDRIIQILSAFLIADFSDRILVRWLRHYEQFRKATSTTRVIRVDADS